MLSELMEQIYQINRKNGWFDSDRSFAETCILIDTETAEAFEDYRKGHLPGEIWFTCEYKECDSHLLGAHFQNWGVCPRCNRTLKPHGPSIEFTDVIVRALDAIYRCGRDPDALMNYVLTYNETRGYRHGGKRV